MGRISIKKEKRERRHKRIRAQVVGTADRPRLAVYKSNRMLYGQIINDTNGVTLFSVRTKEKNKKPLKDQSFEAGKQLAEMAKKKGIEKAVFDRGGFIYTGNVKAFADGAREGGLLF